MNDEYKAIIKRKREEAEREAKKYSDRIRIPTTSHDQAITKHGLIHHITSERQIKIPSNTKKKQNPQRNRNLSLRGYAPTQILITPDKNSYDQ